MQNYKMTDTWQEEDSYTTTEPELFLLAYELFCGRPVGEDLKQAKKEFGKDIENTIGYIEQECGWHAEALTA
ncbi:MAG: hypothetical protein WCG23_11475 [bacterium]